MDKKIKEIPECRNCPHAVKYGRRFGVTVHCTLEPTGMDVTHVNGRTRLCPLLKQDVQQWNKGCKYYNQDKDGTRICSIDMDMIFCSKKCAYATNVVGSTKIKEKKRKRKK